MPPKESLVRRCCESLLQVRRPPAACHKKPIRRYVTSAASALKPDPPATPFTPKYYGSLVSSLSAEGQVPPLETARGSATPHAKAHVRLLPKALLKQDPLRVNDALSVSVNGAAHRFDLVWLRDSCQCHECVDPHSGQKNFQTSDISPHVGLREVSQAEDGSLSMKWHNDIKLFSDDHATTITPEWLANNAVTSARIAEPWPTIWSRSDMERNLKLIDYTSFMQQDDAFGQALVDLQLNGLIFLNNVPEAEESVERIAGRIGPLKTTFYGRTWDVKDKPKAENVAYTSKHLGLHMDLLYMKDPPGVQLLHCLKSSSDGGESIFYDSFHAARTLQSTSPTAFEDLATFPVTYRYNKGGHFFTDTKQTIEMHKWADNSKKTRSGKGIISNINWSPPFQGPFIHDIGLDDYGRKLRQYHLAAKAFAALVDNPESQFTHRLEPGQCVLFLNRRVLHGRKKFESGTGERWLKGAYLNTDDFQSKLKRYWHGGQSRASVAEEMSPQEPARDTIIEDFVSSRPRIVWGKRLRRRGV